MSAIEMIDQTLRASGLPGADEFAEGVWLDCWPGFRDRRIFSTASAMPTGNFISAPTGRRSGARISALPAFPDHVAVIDDGDPERPFRLVAAPSRSFLNTSFNNTPSGIAREGRPTALVHPEVLAGLRLGDGDRLRIGNGGAASSFMPEPSTGMQRRVVIVEGLWPERGFRGGDRDQPVDQRRSGPAGRRRGLSRHFGLAAAGMRRR